METKLKISIFLNVILMIILTLIAGFIFVMAFAGGALSYGLAGQTMPDEKINNFFLTLLTPYLVFLILTISSIVLARKGKHTLTIVMNCILGLVCLGLFILIKLPL